MNTDKCVNCSKGWIAVFIYPIYIIHYTYKLYIYININIYTLVLAFYYVSLFVWYIYVYTLSVIFHILLLTLYNYDFSMAKYWSTSRWMLVNKCLTLLRLMGCRSCSQDLWLSPVGRHFDKPIKKLKRDLDKKNKTFYHMSGFFFFL